MEFQTYFTKQFEISLPDTYIGGDPIKESREIKREIKELGRNQQPLFQRFFKQAIFSFMAADTHMLEGQKKPTACTVNMMKAPARYAKLTPEELMKSMVSQLEGATEVLEADTVKLGDFHAVRVVTSRQKSRGIFGFSLNSRSQSDFGEPPVEKSVTYMFTHAGQFVSMIFTTGPEFYADLLPVFEQSAASLKIH